MFRDLATAVDALTVPVDADAVAAVMAIRDRLDTKLSKAIGERGPSSNDEPTGRRGDDQ